MSTPYPLGFDHDIQDPKNVQNVHFLSAHVFKVVFYLSL